MITENRVLVAWILGFLLTATLSGMGVMVRQYQRQRLVIDGRQLGVRLLGGLVLTAIWVILGALLLSVSPHDDPRLAMALFDACGCLCLALMLLALLDLRLLMLNRLRHEGRFTEEMIRLWCGPADRRAHDS